ncbi:IS66 family transposase (plasmid) [Escherichia coli]|uniref:IS66 family transposase n=1 Tax=Escherichia coli TaxID=562 RepID=UPI0025AB84CF|nr:IS66 family transposase [Escherichia coli]WJS39636.1 IS66 family transposase [Escherichia coli]
MTDDILHTIQNPDELRRLATELLTAQARKYEQRLHNLNTVNSTLEQRIHDLHAAMQAEKTAYEQRIRELEEALKLAQQWRFGRKSERLPASQKPLADEDAASDEADITRQLRDLLPPEEKTGKKPVRQPLPAHLPREETVLAPETGPGDGHPCLGCGAAMRHIRDEVNEVLEYVPAHFVVKCTVRPQYGCPCCDTVHSAAGSARDIVVYDCRPGRGGEYAWAMQAGWSGTLVVDGYAGYSELFRGGQEGESPVASGIREAGCLAHVRRKFMELYRMNGSPGARKALEQIRALYILERTIRSRPAEQKRRWRRRYARPRMEAFHAWLSAGEKTSAPGGALHGAITYALKRWQALTTYLDDGQVPVDNNRCEQMMRPVAQGRRSWLFAGSLRGGERMAELLTLLHTARLNGLEPVAWLRDVLEKLPSWPSL